jgi:hypothetical protein
MPLALLSFSGLLYFSFLLKDKTVYLHINVANLFLIMVENNSMEKEQSSSMGAIAIHMYTYIKNQNQSPLIPSHLFKKINQNA